MGRPLLDYSAAVDMYKSGQSIGEVAKHFGLTRQSMWDSLKRRGVEFRGKVRLENENPFYRGGEVWGRRQSRAVVACAVKKGSLVNPGKCSECGSTQGQISGHHDDYSKPFSVRWLCHSCHFKWHLHNKALPSSKSVFVNSRLRLISLRGEQKTATAWARELGISPVTVLSRLRRGLSSEEALRI